LEDTQPPRRDWGKRVRDGDLTATGHRRRLGAALAVVGLGIVLAVATGLPTNDTGAAARIHAEHHAGLPWLPPLPRRVRHRLLRSLVRKNRTPHMSMGPTAGARPPVRHENSRWGNRVPRRQLSPEGPRPRPINSIPRTTQGDRRRQVLPGRPHRRAAHPRLRPRGHALRASGLG
jgi:hypothetical protein